MGEHSTRHILNESELKNPMFASRADYVRKLLHLIGVKDRVSFGDLDVPKRITRSKTRLLFFERNDTHQNDAMTIDPATQEEINRLDQAVDDFASEMKARLREQAIKGYRGWDDPENYQRIVEMMVKHAAVAEGEEVDAANLAMILWSLRRRGDVD